MRSENTRAVGASRRALPVESGAQAIKDYPLPSAATAFGLGVGVGLVAVYSVLGSMRGRNEEETLAGRIGQQVLGALTDAMPDTLAKRLS